MHTPAATNLGSCMRYNIRGGGIAQPQTTQPPVRERTGGYNRQSIVTIRMMARRFLRVFEISWPCDHELYSSLQKGGDPAAGSPTATLLRLRPSHCARLRRLGLLAEFRHRLRALTASMA